MAGSAGTTSSESTVFVTPPELRYADAALSFVLVAILLLPLLAVGGFVYLVTLAVAVARMAGAAHLCIQWSAPWKLTVGNTHVRVGGHAITFDRIIFLHVAGVSPASRPVGAQGLPRNVSLAVESRGSSRRTIRLRRADADRALAVIHARSDTAAGVDSTGKDYLPRRAEARALGSRRFVRFWAASACVHLLLAVLVLGFSLVVLVRGFNGVEAEAKFFLVLSAVPASLAYGRSALKRARRHSEAARAERKRH
jgi:hypothetical protein